MIFQRQIRYYYLRFIRLRGEPHELALGMGLGVFSGMMPIMPFQIALAVALALFFRGSKIAAAIGTWVSNPFNWYFIFYWDYRLGAWILGLPEKNPFFSSIMHGLRTGEASLDIAYRAVQTGGLTLAAFLLGGVILGIVAAVPAYVAFLPIFRRIRRWRESRRRKKGP